MTGELPGALPPPPTEGSEDAPGARLSVELQITYATGIVAGTSAAAYYIMDYGRQTGFTSAWDMYLACAIAMLLEMVTCGMVLHLMYRGFWIAMKLLVETRSDEGLATRELSESWEKEIRSLDAACQSFFFKTFRFLYIGMIVFIANVGIRLSESPSWVKRLEGDVLLALMVAMPLVKYARRLAGESRAGQLLRRLADRLADVRRFMGLWWLQSDPRKVSASRSVIFVVLANILVGLNLGWMVHAQLDCDKPVYFQSAKDKVFLTFRHGGYIPGPEATVELKVRTKGLRAKLPQPSFRMLAPGRYAGVVDCSDFEPGAAEVEVEMKLQRTEGKGKLSLVPDPASATFLVAP